MSEHERAVRNVVANQALEGLTLPKRSAERVRAVADGTLDVEEAIAALRDEYREDGGDAAATAG